MTLHNRADGCLPRSDISRTTIRSLFAVLPRSLYGTLTSRDSTERPHPGGARCEPTIRAAHAICLDGAYSAARDGKGLMFHPAPSPSQEEIESLVGRASKRILRLLLQRRKVITLVTVPGDGDVTVVGDETMGEKDPLPRWRARSWWPPTVRQFPWPLPARSAPGLSPAQ